MPLLSHPDLLLNEHIQQVAGAMEALLSWHTKDVASPTIRILSQLLVKLHDAGKSTNAFQEYIASPETYKGDRQEKSHSQLSALLALLISEERGLPPLEALAIGAAAYGHHTRLPSIEQLADLGYESKTLKRQCITFDSASLEKEIGLPVSTFDFTNRPWAKTKKYLNTQVIPVLEQLPIYDAVSTRLCAQLLFSLLLEADKALLAVKDPQVYLRRQRKDWSPDWIEKRIGSPKKTTVNNMRLAARKSFIENLENTSKSISSLTAPTGIGKTLLAATWALVNRKKIANETGAAPKIIVVLPFLSIIDQTAKEYENLLKYGVAQPDGEWFLTYHSLSDRQYWHNHQDYDPETSHEAFFIDTWRTELVITTYDQFLLALMAPNARYQMRFHNLCDALIIIDEVQALPCRLWKPLENILQALADMGNSRILLMSATLPPFIENSAQLLSDYEKYFHAFSRYKIELRLQEIITIEEFSEEIKKRLPDLLASKKRVLLTLNTRKSARFLRDKIEQILLVEGIEVPLFFISADVTPRDRLHAIGEIRKGYPCIVVSTQCIEAGVDIDMDLVIRDFAPLDSIIQIAGRCNREGMKKRCLIEVVELCNEQNVTFSKMIYDNVHLFETKRILNGIEKINEEEILDFSNQYFIALSQKKSLGEEHLERFARWEEDEPVHELLRGKDEEKHTFIVIDQDPELKRELQVINAIDNHWQRREALRKIAARIANISVSIFARKDFDPEDIAENWFGLWLLKEGHYDSQRGLVLPQEQAIGAIDDTLIL